MWGTVVSEKPCFRIMACVQSMLAKTLGEFSSGILLQNTLQETASASMQYGVEVVEELQLASDDVAKDGEGRHLPEFDEPVGFLRCRGADDAKGASHGVVVFLVPDVERESCVWLSTTLGRTSQLVRLCRFETALKVSPGQESNQQRFVQRRELQHTVVNGAQ